MVTQQHLSNILNQLGFTAKICNSNYIVIDNFKLPDNWPQDSISILLQIPPDFPSNRIYGIFVPADFLGEQAGQIKVGKLPSEVNECGLNWTRLSFYVEYKNNLNSYLTMHMKTANKVLSFESI